ncbi:MAG TPA: MBL fold metallo-hydrolase, partial [Gemmatimonadaceae bacterium]|nr:MBL fold metallo-hydrolase [Gemmatimonadaceae bacterium]
MSAPQPLVESRVVGGFKIHALQAGGQKLDGGAMFGVVPKPLWERRIPADERNRIPLGMRCILIEHDDGLVLIDCGSGNKENARFLDIYGIENAGANGRTALEDALAVLGQTPDDIAIMIDSHLHFDHGGGNTYRNESGAIVPTFPKARYVVQRGELDYASHTNERTAASYFPHNFAPIVEAGLFDLVEGEKQIVPGITV